MAAKRLNRQRPFSIGFEPVNPSTLWENLVEIRRAVLKIEWSQTLKKTDAAENNTFQKSFPGGKKHRIEITYHSTPHKHRQKLLLHRDIVPECKQAT